MVRYGTVLYDTGPVSYGTIPYHTNARTYTTKAIEKIRGDPSRTVWMLCEIFVVPYFDWQICRRVDLYCGLRTWVVRGPPIIGAIAHKNHVGN